jgi:aminocarboxymuconate-semialdehyde decarboxylase
MTSTGVIDVHTHVIPDLPDHAVRLADDRWPSFTVDGAVGRLSRDGSVVRTVGPAAWDMTARIAEMDRAGVQRHVLSPIPPLICDWGSAADAASWARHLNDSIAAMVRARPDRFSGLGTVSLHHPDAALDELDHVTEAGLCGVEIGTDAGGRELDDPVLLPFFAKAERLGLLLFVHPLILGAVTSFTDRIRGHELTFGLGMGTDTAIAAGRLAFGGVTRACPRLRICLAHGGGTFFWALARIARLWDRADRPAADRTATLTASIVVDSVVYDPRNVGYLVGALGPERVLFGTDFPLPAQDDLSGAVLRELSGKEREQILGENAARLIGLAQIGLARVGLEGAPACTS